LRRVPAGTAVVPGDRPARQHRRRGGEALLEPQEHLPPSHVEPAEALVVVVVVVVVGSSSSSSSARATGS
jgi:hypothetical protein